MSSSYVIRITAITFVLLTLMACSSPPAATPVPVSTIAPTVPPTAAPPTLAPTAVPPTATIAPTVAPTSAPPGASVLTLNLAAGRDGDQTPGTVTFTAQGAKTQVVVNLKSGAAGVAQPNHIHEGACPGVGAVKFPLTNVVDGKGTTVIDANLKDLLIGGFAVNIHESAANSGKYVACVNIPKGTAINLGPGRDSDQTPAGAILIANGAKTDVIVTLKPGPAGVAQPNHLHEGACPGVGAVKFPLTNIVDGAGKTTLDASIDDVLKGGYSLNIHESTVNSGKYVACGAVGGAPVAAPTKGAIDPPPYDKP